MKLLFFCFFFPCRNSWSTFWGPAAFGLPCWKCVGRCAHLVAPLRKVPPFWEGSVVRGVGRSLHSAFANATRWSLTYAIPKDLEHTAKNAARERSFFVPFSSATEATAGPNILRRPWHALVLGVRLSARKPHPLPLVAAAPRGGVSPQ